MRFRKSTKKQRTLAFEANEPRILLAADTVSASDVDVWYRNKEADIQTDVIEAEIEVFNRSAEAANFKGLEIRYAMRADGLTPVVDITRTNAPGLVEGTFLPHGLYAYFQVTDDFIVEPDEELKIRFEVTNTESQPFDQSNDPSFIQSQTRSAPTDSISISISQIPFESASDEVFGTDKVTFDRNSGLEWLDLDLSLGRSYNDVASQFGAGGDFEGWRHATLTEVTQLFENAGFDLFMGTQANLNEAEAVEFIDLFGDTSASSPFDLGNRNAEGLLDNEDGTGSVGTAAVHHPGITTPFADIIPTTSLSANSAFHFRANWLVRERDPQTPPTDDPGIPDPPIDITDGIQQDVVDNYAQIQFFTPRQTFLVESPHVVISLWISEYNSFINDDSFYFTLSGSVNAGRTVMGIPDGYEGWVDIDISHAELPVGETQAFTLYNDTGRWAVGYAETDEYADGELLIPRNSGSFPGNPENSDLTFRITPVEKPDPILPLESASDVVFGNDSITLDPNTGLQWLDLSESTSRSYSNVQTQFGPDGDFAGWRHGTFEEVMELWDNADLFPEGLVPSAQVDQTVPLSNVASFIALLDDTDGASSFGYLNNETNTEEGFANYAHVNHGSYGGIETTASAAASSTVGHWLVRTEPADPLPEPVDPLPELNLEVFYQNKEPDASSDVIEAKLEVYNRDSSEVNLKGTEFRYVFDPDGLTPEIKLKSTNADDALQSSFVENGAARYVAFTIEDDFVVAPNQRLKVKFEINNAEGSDFDQTNDASFIATQTSLSPTTSIEIHRGDSSEPPTPVDPVLAPTLSSADDPIFGVDSITVDSDTGLEWLDLTESVGRSYNDVDEEFGQGGDYRGWRHATFTEVTKLFENASITPSPDDFDPAVANLRDLVGVTTNVPANVPATCTAAAYNRNGILDSDGNGNLELSTLDVETGMITRIGQEMPTRVHGLIMTNSGDIFAVNNWTDSFYSIDPTSGLPSIIGDTGWSITAGIAYDSANDIIYGLGEDSSAGSDVQRLLIYNRDTGIGTAIGSGIDGLTSTSALTWDSTNGRLIAFDNADDEFYAFDSDGNGTKLSNADFPGTANNSWSMAFDGTHVLMQLAGYGSNNVLAVMDPDTGQSVGEILLSDSAPLEALHCSIPSNETSAYGLLDEEGFTSQGEDDLGSASLVVRNSGETLHNVHLISRLLGGRNASSPVYGHWLVRETNSEPEPANPISGEIRDGKVVLISSEPTALSGLDLQSPAGNLVPVEQGIGSAPFTFFLANTPNQILWGNLGTNVLLDGELNTNATYNGDPAGDLLGFWGDGPTPIPFEITVASEPDPPTDPEPVDDFEVLYLNKQPSVSSDVIEAKIELYNRGTETVDFNGVELRYFVDFDGLTSNLNVTSTNAPALGAGVFTPSGEDSYVSFLVSDTFLVKPNKRLKLRFDITSMSGDPFDQSNDSSFIESQTTLAPTTSIEVLRNI